MNYIEKFWRTFAAYCNNNQFKTHKLAKPKKKDLYKTRLKTPCILKEDSKYQSEKLQLL